MARSILSYRCSRRNSARFSLMRRGPHYKGWRIRDAMFAWHFVLPWSGYNFKQK